MSASLEGPLGKQARAQAQSERLREQILPCGRCTSDGPFAPSDPPRALSTGSTFATCPAASTPTGCWSPARSCSTSVRRSTTSSTYSTSGATVVECPSPSRPGHSSRSTIYDTLQGSNASLWRIDDLSVTRPRSRGSNPYCAQVHGVVAGEPLWSADSARLPPGDQSTQSSERSTAWFHFAYPVSRSSSDICGSQRLSSLQRSRSSSWSDQYPTARPAA